MDKEETAAPFPEGEKGGGDSGYGERVPHDGGEQDGGGEQFEKSEHTCLSNELVVKRNEPTERHFTLGWTAKETTRTTK